MSGLKWSDIVDGARHVKDKVEKSIRNFVDGFQASVDLRKAISQTQMESRRQMEITRQDIEKERKAHQRSLEKMQGEIREMAERHHQAMEEQRNAFSEAQLQQREAILSEVSSLKDWTSEQLDRHDAKFEAITQRHEKKINQLEDDVQRFIQQEQGQEYDYAANIE